VTDYNEILSNREATALAFDEAMIGRYGVAAEDCRYWKTIHLDELSNSHTVNHNIEAPFVLDYSGDVFPEPMPYSQRFLYRFAEIINGPSQNIIPILEDLFDHNDYVEHDYISALIREIEKVSTDSPNTIAVVDGRGFINIIGRGHGVATADEDHKKALTEGMGCALFDCPSVRSGITTVREWLSRRHSLNTNDTKSITINTTKGDFTSIELALYYYYEGQTITRNNANAFANGANSEALYQDFSFITTVNNRTLFETKRRCDNMIKRINKVMAKLSSEGVQRARKDISIIERNKLSSLQ
jgi:hypothetical protein